MASVTVSTQTVSTQPLAIFTLLFYFLVATGTAIFCQYDHRGRLEDDDDKDFLNQPGNCSPGEPGTVTARALSSRQTTYCRLTDIRTVDASDNWDVSFQRFRIGTNSGTSATGLGGACPTGQSQLAVVTSVADCLSPFEEDRDLAAAAAQGDEVRFSGNPLLSSWFDYEFATHTLTSRMDVYIVRSADGNSHYKMQILSYYSLAGTPAYTSFRYELLP